MTETVDRSERRTRRQFLSGAAGWLAMAGAPAWLAGCAGVAGPARRVIGLLCGELAFPEPLAIGRSVLASTPEPLDAAVLWARVLEGLPLDDAAAASRAWRERCRREFASGDRLVVDGWRLALAEGTLCAALALEGPPSAAEAR